MTEMNNSNTHKTIKRDGLEANSRDKVVSTGDEGGGDGSIAQSMKSTGTGRGCYMTSVNAKYRYFLFF